MSRISVDLATVFPDKWAALDPGEHTIQIRAKNPGNYLDSDLSMAITFVIANTTSMVCSEYTIVSENTIIKE